MSTSPLPGDASNDPTDDQSGRFVRQPNGRGPDAYATFTAWMGSPLGLLVWIGLTAALAYHFAGGVRHLIWDAGEGLTPKSANLLSTVSIAFAVVVTVAFWAGLFMTGRVSL